VAAYGYGAMTGFGYYQAGKPGTFHDLQKILPEPVKRLIRIIPAYTYLHELPRLSSKAVFYQNEERGQAHELLGCFEHKIPSLGFIVSPRIKGKNNSTYLANNGRWTECVAYDKSFCSHEMSPDRFCPFYDQVQIPWTSLELFLTKENMLVAVNDLDDIDYPLEQFLARLGESPAEEIQAIAHRKMEKMLSVAPLRQL
jgi:hypothetical protein